MTDYKSTAGDDGRAGDSADMMQDTVLELELLMATIEARIRLAEHADPLCDAFAKLEDVKAGLEVDLGRHEREHGIENGRARVAKRRPTVSDTIVTCFNELRLSAEGKVR